MTKSTKSATIAFPVALKTMHDHIVRDNPNATIDTKRMRVKLRVELRDTHDRNNAWVFNNQKDYDRVRSMFDPAYATRIAKPARVRRAKSTPAPVTTDA